MTTLLSKDADNNVIPALRLKDGGAHNLTITGSAARNTTAFDDGTKVISVFSTVGVYLKFGDDSVTATGSDHYLPANIYYDIVITGGSGKGAHNAYLSRFVLMKMGSFIFLKKNKEPCP